MNAPWPPPRRRRSRTREVLVSVGAALVVVALGLLATPIVKKAGVCAFLPCTPLEPEVGIVLQSGDDLRLEVGPTTAAQVQDVEVRAWAGEDGTQGALYWQIQRIPGSHVTWDGSAALGEVPDGFEQISPPRFPEAGEMEIEIGSECWSASNRVKDVSKLLVGELHSSLGSTSVEKLRATDTGFWPCDMRPTHEEARSWHLAALGSFVTGGLLLVIALMTPNCSRVKTSR